MEAMCLVVNASLLADRAQNVKCRSHDSLMQRHLYTSSISIHRYGFFVFSFSKKINVCIDKYLITL